MLKQAAKKWSILNLLDDIIKSKKVRQATKYSVLGSLGGIAGGIGYDTFKGDHMDTDPTTKIVNKIRHNLTMKEMQSESSPITSARELSNVRLDKVSASKADLGEMGMYAGAGAIAAGVPAYILYRDYMKKNMDKRVDENRDAIRQMLAKYDENFRRDVLEEAGIRPVQEEPAPAEQVEEMTAPEAPAVGEEEQLNKTEMEKESVAISPSMGVLLGSSLGTLGYTQGKASVEKEHKNLKTLKAYNELLERIVRLANRPVQLTAPVFTPEEERALISAKLGKDINAAEEIEDEPAEIPGPVAPPEDESIKKAEIVKDTVSTRPSDNRLQEVIAKI